MNLQEALTKQRVVRLMGTFKRCVQQVIFNIRSSNQDERRRLSATIVPQSPPVADSNATTATSAATAVYVTNTAANAYDGVDYYLVQENDNTAPTSSSPSSSSSSVLGGSAGRHYSMSLPVLSRHDSASAATAPLEPLARGQAVHSHTHKKKEGVIITSEMVKGMLSLPSAALSGIVTANLQQQQQKEKKVVRALEDSSDDDEQGIAVQDHVTPVPDRQKPARSPLKKRRKGGGKKRRAGSPSKRKSPAKKPKKVLYTAYGEEGNGEDDQEEAVRIQKLLSSPSKLGSRSVGKSPGKSRAAMLEQITNENAARAFFSTFNTSSTSSSRGGGGDRNGHKHVKSNLFGLKVDTANDDEDGQDGGDMDVCVDLTNVH